MPEVIARVAPAQRPMHQMPRSVNSTIFSRTLEARPESIDARARAMPASMDGTTPATYRAAPAFSSTASRGPPGSPRSTSPGDGRILPRVSPGQGVRLVTGDPVLLGVQDAERRRPSPRSPPGPCWARSRTARRSHPHRGRGALARIPCARAPRPAPPCTPVRSRPAAACWTPAGLVSGPRKLKTVLTPSAFLTPATRPEAG